ncbi:MAG: glycosyltransferase family 39 protein [Flavobacteriales bacterium]
MSRTDKLVLTVLVLLNAAVKLAWLRVNELSGDEPFTVFWAQQGTRDLLAMFQEENNPPLYFFLMKWWSAAAPLEVAWLRVPSAVFSAIAVWPLFLFARKHLSIWAAISACLLFTFCNEHYAYAHEVRAYGLLTLLAITAMWQLDRLARRKPRAFLWLVAVNALMAYTHFMGWAAMGIQFLCLLVVAEWRHALRTWLKTLGIAVVLFVPYGHVFVQRVGSSVVHGTWLAQPAWDEPYSMLWRWSNQPAITVLFLCAIAFACWRTRAKNIAMRVGLLWAGTPLIGLFIVSFFVPLYLDRYLVWAAPGFAMLVVACLEQLTDKQTVVRVALIAACAAMLVTFRPWAGNGMHPSRVAEQVRQWDEEGGTSFTVLPYWYTLNWAAAEDLALFRDPYALETWNAVKSRGVGGYDPTHPVAGSDAPDGPVILIDADARTTTPSPEVRSYLRANYPRIDSVEADRKVWVYRFRK